MNRLNLVLLFSFLSLGVIIESFEPLPQTREEFTQELERLEESARQRISHYGKSDNSYHIKRKNKCAQSVNALALFKADVIQGNEITYYRRDPNYQGLSSRNDYTLEILERIYNDIRLREENSSK